MFSTMQRLNALPLMPNSPLAKAAARHSLKGQNNRTQYQVCGPSICRASAAVSEERITNGKARPMTLQAPQQPCEAGRLTDDGTAFLEEHRIRGYEVGPDQKTTIVTIANLLQEVAGNHAVALWGRTDAGYATDPLMVERHLIFAVTRMQIRMDSYPKWGDLVQIETWFQEEGRVSACRNWILTNQSTGEEIGRATSTWVMVNTLTRRLSKMPEEMRAKMEYLAPHPSRDVLPAAEVRQKIPDLEDPPEIEGPVQVARRSDMDMNGHINNVTYLGWALETVPADVYLNYSLHEVEIDYKSECMAGQTVESIGSRIKEDTNGTGILRFVHMLRRCDDSGCYELVRARTTWRPQYGKLQLH
ncbi:Palmitoyl-acyl carrier protein thioesterase, chloroplastic [Coccomyxa sp. Obi]|nr:Palmitoyl-acyl carrier protein thioesterase, chloroplastic [Coccomyxa sp. Obi]